MQKSLEVHYYVIGKNEFQPLYKCIQQKHHCQGEAPKEDKTLRIVSSG